MAKKTPPPAKPRRPRSSFNTYASDDPVRSVKLQLGNNIRNAMNAKGWNGSELARQMEAIRPPHPGRRDIGRDMVNHWLHGIHMPSAEFIGLLAKVLDMRVSELVPDGLMLGADDIIPFAITTLPGGRAELVINMHVPGTIAMKVSLFLKGDPRKKQPYAKCTTLFEDGKTKLKVNSIVPAGIAYTVQQLIFGKK